VSTLNICFNDYIGYLGQGLFRTWSYAFWLLELCRWKPTFRKNMLPLSSGFKN